MFFRVVNRDINYMSDLGLGASTINLI